MEDILALILIFGGGTAVALSFSPVGRAVAARIRGETAKPQPDPELQAEVDLLRQDVTELQERLDFAERMLAQRPEAARLQGD
ncbi:MAG TPA: hypothetical protein VFM14_18565 [Gemmatimonadales bacterium]|nr:hypothetical protein [Gemmatimonadales bacterium]